MKSQDPRMWLYLETGPLERKSRQNEVLWVGPNPIRLVSLEEEIRTQALRPRGEHVRKQ